MGASPQRRRPKRLQTVTLLTRLAASPPVHRCENLFDAGFAAPAVQLDSPLRAGRSWKLHEDGTEATGTVRSLFQLCARMQLLVQQETKLYFDDPGAAAGVTAQLEATYFRLQRECVVWASEDRKPAASALCGRAESRRAIAEPDPASVDRVLSHTGLARLFPEVCERERERESERERYPESESEGERTQERVGLQRAVSCLQLPLYPRAMTAVCARAGPGPSWRGRREGGRGKLRGSFPGIRRIFETHAADVAGR